VAYPIEQLRSDTHLWFSPNVAPLEDEVKEASVIDEHLVCIFSARVAAIRTHRSWFDTEVISNWYEEPAPLSESEQREDHEKTVRTLADKWRKDTHFISVLRRKFLHPSYQQIIGMGRDAIPLILKELDERPADWFWALNAITREDPVPEHADFDQAVAAWLNWGREHHYL
jgi:hypothetical protein